MADWRELRLRRAFAPEIARFSKRAPELAEGIPGDCVTGRLSMKLSVKVVNNGIAQADSGAARVRGFRSRDLRPFWAGARPKAWPTKHSGAGRYVGGPVDSASR